MSEAMREITQAAAKLNQARQKAGRSNYREAYLLAEEAAKMERDARHRVSLPSSDVLKTQLEELAQEAHRQWAEHDVSLIMLLRNLAAAAASLPTPPARTAGALIAEYLPAGLDPAPQAAAQRLVAYLDWKGEGAGSIGPALYYADVRTVAVAIRKEPEGSEQ